MIVRKLSSAPSPASALELLSTGPHPFLLQSAAGDERFGRYSFAGVDPFRTLSVRGVEPFQEMRRLLAEFAIAPDCPTPLPAGMVGFLSYDLARVIERLPKIATDDLGLPDVCLHLYDRVITWDHATGKTFLTSTGLPLRGEESRQRAHEREEQILELLDRPPPPAGQARPLSSPLTSGFSRDGYVAAVIRAKMLIAAGDIFQVNLSQRFSASTGEAGGSVYRRLMEVNPADFAAYVTSSCGAEIISASPERFLQVAGDRVETSPVKGTIRRDPDPTIDARLAAELLASEKDNAELTMIVDLLRNDLGRVAEFGSVAVTELPTLTSHPTVHHLHGTVTARLTADRDVVDLVRAAFPGGSVTGAPKVRAMEIIEGTEPVRRGAYTGSIGYFSFTGNTDLNIAIRTLTLKEGRISFTVGGGIIADSDPASEYEETLHKGRGLAEALGVEL